MDQFREAFREEAHELLAELETALLELEKDPGAADLIGRVFRAMHTLKGSSGMFGFDDINKLTHDIENVYDLVRGGKIPVTSPLIDMTLRACDEVKKMIEPREEGDAGPDLKAALAVSASFRTYLESSRAASVPDAARDQAGKQTDESNDTDKDKDRTMTYRISFRPAADIFLSGTNPVLLLNEVRDLGLCHIIAKTEQIPPLDEINPEACYTGWEILLTSEHDINAIRDVFIFVEDRCTLNIEEIPDDSGAEADKEDRKLGEILVERGDISGSDLRKILDSHKKIGEILVESGLVGAEKVEAALVEQIHTREVKQRKQVAETAASIRVPAEKLDRLVNMVGELVTVQSRLSQISTQRNDPLLIQVAEEVERLMAELRDNTMSIRMLPIGSTFSRFERLVRDLSAELGREVVLKTEGAETELDKTVIEKLNDPLVHLIRNCIDHGIEPPHIREAAGKPRQGTVLLAAEHSGAHVVITIRDDGAGLDGEAIRAKAIERGLIAPDTQLSEKDLYALILQPGFSTAKKVSSVSGRGVGMDVVKRGIETLQGTIEIVSEKGRGSSIILKLPLTLAIIDGLLVRIGDDYFIMPLAAIEECVELTEADIARAHGKCIAEIRGEIVPYLRLRDAFAFIGERPAIEQIVTTRINGSRVGFVVDQVVGGHQTVIKNLGRMCRDVHSVSGATILGDGTVALILDLPKIVQQAEQDEATNRKQRGY
ncbi:MAG: chemotaxis protein CheA [Deltaproteobacteria bacterium]|nr:chemotaxis protein CheA [Deltaproteobacteria bacterium]